MPEMQAGQHGDEAEVIEGQPASALDSFLCDWGRESFKQNIPLLNDTLRSLLTLSTALSGSSLLLLTRAAPAVRLIAAACFLAAMVAALLGILPRTGRVCLSIPDEILAHKLGAERRKTIAAQAAAAAIVAGLVVLGASLLG